MITSAWAEVKSHSRRGSENVNIDSGSDSGGRVLDRFGAMMTEFEVGMSGVNTSQVDVVWPLEPRE